MSFVRGHLWSVSDILDISQSPFPAHTCTTMSSQGALLSSDIDGGLNDIENWSGEKTYMEDEEEELEQY